MASADHNPIAVSVTDLQGSFSFYISALQPLGYQYINHVHHQTTDSSSESIDLGPVNTTRVDVSLSQSRPGVAGKGPSHIIFPAISTVAVREFYAAALNAGGRVVSSPKTTDNSASIFSATVADFDGNEIEVCYTDPTVHDSHFPTDCQSTAPPISSAILKWRDTVADQTASNPSRALTTSRGFRDVDQPLPTEVLTRSRRDSYSSSKKSGRSKTSDSNGSKPVVGTLIGAAAGAALVYALKKELDDSKAKEAAFTERMEARRRVKAEAKAHAIASQWREKASRSSGRRSSWAGRDSGYNSPPSSRREPSPDVIRYRTITYPPPRSPSRKDSLSGTTARTSRAAEPAAAPSARSRPVTHVTVSSPPSKPPRPSPPGSRNKASNQVERSPTSNSRSKTRESTTSRDAAQTVSRNTLSRSPTKGTNTTTKTFRYVPVTAQNTSGAAKSGKNAESSKNAQSRYSAREVMPSPEEPPNRSPDHYIKDLDLDDATVVPDDSVSCVSSDAGPRHRAPRARHGNPSRGKGPLRRMGVAY